LTARFAFTVSALSRIWSGDLRQPPVAGVPQPVPVHLLVELRLDPRLQLGVGPAPDPARLAGHDPGLPHVGQIHAAPGSARPSRSPRARHVAARGQGTQSRIEK
jgi:hypothetical protein